MLGGRGHIKEKPSSRSEMVGRPRDVLRTCQGYPRDILGTYKRHIRDVLEAYQGTDYRS